MSVRPASIVECERRVAHTLSSSAPVRLLLRALSDAGCPVTSHRHIVCEECSDEVRGGYDSQHNQLVICCSRRDGAPDAKAVETLLAHELVHAYDYCTKEIDFSQPRHLACSEVRAANLTECLPTLGHLLVGDAREDCVRATAAKSVSVITGLSAAVSRAHVDGVFGKCYADLEPLGRRAAAASSSGLMGDYSLFRRYKQMLARD